MRLPRTLTDVLESSGLPWRVEKKRRHAQLYLCDRVVLTMPIKWDERYNGRQAINAVAAVRRAVRCAAARADGTVAEQQETAR